MSVYNSIGKTLAIPVALASIYLSAYAQGSSPSTQPATQPTTQPATRPTTQPATRPSIELAEEYKDLRPEFRRMRLAQRQMLVNRLAGVYAGTVKVVKTEQGYSWKGSYAPLEHPEAMEKMLKDADSDDNRKVTTLELRSLEKKVLEDSASK